MKTCRPFWCCLLLSCLSLIIAPAFAAPMKDGFSLAIKFDRNYVSALVGDGMAWRILKQIPRADLGGQPIALRAGKMSLKADNSDFATPGEIGDCRIENVKAIAQTNPNYSAEFKSETVNPLLTAAPYKLAGSPRPETKIAWDNNALQISATTNSAAFGEWLVNPVVVDDALFSCRVYKNSDKGLSWGPGLALIWPNGQFFLVNARFPLGEWSVTTREGETLIHD